MIAGIKENYISIIQSILQKYSSIDVVKVFGSRAKGNFDVRSDLDMAAFGDDIKTEEMNMARLDLEETDLPFAIDFINYESIKNSSLKEHINRVGTIIYQKKEQ